MSEDRIDLGNGIYAGPKDEQDWRTIYRVGDKPGRRIGHMEDEAVQSWQDSQQIVIHLGIGQTVTTTGVHDGKPYIGLRRHIHGQEVGLVREPAEGEELPPPEVLLAFHTPPSVLGFMDTFRLMMLGMQRARGISDEEIARAHSGTNGGVLDALLVPASNGAKLNDPVMQEARAAILARMVPEWDFDVASVPERTPVQIAYLYYSEPEVQQRVNSHSGGIWHDFGENPNIKVIAWHPLGPSPAPAKDLRP